MCMREAVIAPLLCAVKLSYGDWPMCKQAQTSQIDNSCRTSKGLVLPMCLLRSARHNDAEARKAAAGLKPQGQLHVLLPTYSIMDDTQNLPECL